MGALAVAVLAVVIAVVIFIRQENTEIPSATQECGWELTEPEGVQAHNQYMTQTALWLGNRDPSSLEKPPTPDSPYWLGDCPIDPDSDGEPPIHENDH